MTASPPGAAPAATIGRRVGAFAIDIGVAWVIGAVLVGIVVGIIFGVGPAWDRDGLAVMILLSYAGIGLLLFAWWLVYSAMQGSGGGSIGQRILGLRLHDAASAAPIGFWRAILRNIVFSLAASIVVGYFTPLFDASGRRQGWHDMASRALVVDIRKRDAAPPAPAATATANPYLPPPTGAASLAPAPSLQPAGPLPAPGFMPAHAAPASTRPAAPVSTGVIADVPWITHEPGPTRAAGSFPSVTMPFPAATTTEPLGATATASTVVPASAEEDVESTRIVVPPPAQRAALYDGAPVLAVLTWDDGTRMAVYGRTLYGRNPASGDGAVAIPVRDETLSLSKTHFEVGGDTAGAWIADRHSTNGTTLVRDGGRIPLTPGVRTNLRDGDTLEFGDRRVTVGLER
ncbi:putative RDD family membrane protein YckC [Microbacterium sp. BE35]|uniref:RDD family protein n=1 Tax=Microbacterium sp. BE35 TaxID=2817773 RepID=UPI0028559043|nr:RDD family protein [Microbacterium sp. BE35]MDR7191164.1 putative RDD family membrane protein YckC [Microbacterium sp. BE35]